MNASQFGPRSLHGGALDGARFAGSGTASTNGEAPARTSPRTWAGAVAFPDRCRPTPSGATPPPRESITMTDTMPVTCCADGQAHQITDQNVEEQLVSDRDDAAVLLSWITLSRVADGCVTQQGDRYLDAGAPLPPYLAAPIAALLTEGCLALADPDPTGCRRVNITEAGRVRHDQLCRRAVRGVDR